jgi:sulfite reductase (NADPH) hemoprotein beta-component
MVHRPPGVPVPAAQVQDRVTGRRTTDRAVIKAHDIGLQWCATRPAKPGSEVFVGGGPRPHPDDRQGDPRLPARRPTCCPISRRSCASTTCSAAGTTSTRRASRSRCTSTGSTDPRLGSRRIFPPIRAMFCGVRTRFCAASSTHFAPPPSGRADTAAFEAARAADPVFRAWPTPTSPRTSAGPRHRHRLLKAHRRHAGRCHAAQMRALADLAERYGHDELRISHEQNVILPHVHKSDLPAPCAAVGSTGSPRPISA